MDHIQKLLTQTGWSCEDLINKLAEYKRNNELKTESESQTKAANKTNIENNTPCDIKKPTKNGTCKKRRKFVQNVSHELGDHTYTLNVKPRRRVETNPRSRRNRRLRSSCAFRLSNLSLKARRLRSRHLRRKRIDRKALIAQYKSPEVVRSQILQQLRLLRSRRSDLAVAGRKQIPEDKIVSKKRYVGEKCSDVLNELMEFAEDQNVVIESSDILQSTSDVVIDAETFESATTPLPYHEHTVKTNESITETIRNRIGTAPRCVAGTSSNANARINHMKINLGCTKEHCRINDDSMKANELPSSPNNCSIDEEDSVESSIKDILIVDVRGGCEIIPDDKLSDQNHMIKPTKTKDITKIKGWKNKRFDVTDDTSNAAFASSNLDGFLEAADLHISFKIPTLDSGPPTIEEIPKVLTPQVSPNENDADPLNLYRPRTLGQKKRIMKLKYDLKSKKNIQKPRTLAEKRRLLGNDVEKIKMATIPKDVNSRNYSYILHRGKKLRVVTRSQNDNILAYIKSLNNKPNYMYVPKKVRVAKDKPSIFKNTYSPTSPVLRYRPGPLCHKANLQYDNQNWKTILKKLPKVKLTVVPEYRKPIHPYIRGLLPEYGCEITPDRLQFALTALKPTIPEVTCFEFEVPYQNNQEEIVLRKNIVATALPEAKVKDDEQEEASIKEICQDVVDKILDYLEIKEISDDIIKSDVNTRFLTEDKIMEPRKDNKPTGISKKRRKRGSKTNYELKRLNVKVIEVNLEEKEEIKNCKKDFCRLGCVCRSLSTSFSLVSSHCGRPECMFECTCNYERKSKGNVRVTLPIGIDLLSEGAVNRLEDEAKKNLARVEKEFTQTVIQANNQTIVVGGCSNRQRRATKLPKKYTDYVEDPEYVPPNILRQIQESTEKYKDEKNCQTMEFSINLTKLDLHDVIPFCLVHNLYDCHCGYEADYIAKEPAEPETSDAELEEKTEGNDSDMNKLESTNLDLGMANDDDIPYITIMLKRLQEEGQMSSRKLLLNMDCARTKGIPTDYYMVRNRTNRYIKVRNRKFLKNMSKVGFHHDMQTDHEELKPTDDPLWIKDVTADNSHSTVTVTTEKSRRKQELVVRIDREMCIIETPEKKSLKPVNKLPKKYSKKPNNIPDSGKKSNDILESGKKTTDNLDSGKKSNDNLDSGKKSTDITTSKLAENNSSNIRYGKLVDIPVGPKPIEKDINAPILKFKKIFPFARENVNYFQPSPDIAGQFVSMLGKKETTTFCLLQWQTLATNYRLGKINVWFSSYFNFPKIVVTDLSIVPKYFTNVKNFESDASRPLQKNEIVKALISDSIPGTNPKDEVQVILELTDILCHVHGTIKRNQDKQENLLVAQKKSPKVIQTQSLFEKNEKELQEKAKRIRLPYPTVRKIMFSKLKCLQYIYVTIDKDGENILPQSVTARLPAIKNTALWRMIKLNSDFSVLSLDNSDYRIKYSDLQKVLKMADDKDMTIAIKTEPETSARSHKDFGIYASPKCQNAVFVGPYYRVENHDITLMRYLNRELVPTKFFNKMKGLPPANVGVWIEQSKDALTAEKSLHTIDLTGSDHEESVNNREENKGLLVTPADLEKYENECENYYATQSYYVELDVTKKLPTFQGNVYFSTNIASLGYILGHQLSGDAVLVRYPTFNSVLGFKNHAHAVTYLEKEFQSSFIEVPGFHIKIIITDKEDNSGIVFNPEFLKSYYVVSENGLTNVLELTSAKLESLDMTEDDLDSAIKFRASRMIYDQCLEAARTSLNILTFKQRRSTMTLLNMLRLEAESLTFDQQRYKLEKVVALQRKPLLLEHFKEIFVHLAPYVNLKLRAKMQEVLKRHGRMVDIEETIKADNKNDSNNLSSSKIKTEVNLPIYTKNPDMIITATSSPKENTEDKVPKIVVKELKKEKAEIKVEPVKSEKKNRTAEIKPKFSNRLEIYRYLRKTATGTITEIEPEEYERLRAHYKKIKASKQSSLMKAFQIGPVTVTPKLSKADLDPIMATLPTAELKRISTTDNLPPGFVKLTLKSSPQKSVVENSTANDVRR